MFTNIEINHKGWVIEATHIENTPTITPGMITYIYGWGGANLAEDLFRSALVLRTEWTYQQFKDLPEHERKSIVQTWLNRCSNGWKCEEPDIVY